MIECLSSLPVLPLFRLAMNRMMAAAAAKLLRFQTLRILLLILRYRVVAFLAVRAL
jgi:hypothetical protein